jgi:predicted methyltransferase
MQSRVLGSLLGCLACLVLGLTAASVVMLHGAAQPPASGRLFPPEDLGVLESPDRDEWQQPERVMDALGIADGSHVADLGAGGGWFTIRLAGRVGPNGLVYAEDIQPEMIDAIQHRVRDHALTNVRAILGTPADPHLPAGLDAILVVDTYPQLSDPAGLLRELGKALAPTGLLGIIDFTRDGVGGPGPPLGDRLDPDAVRRDADRAGLTFDRAETFLRYQYMLVFRK